MMIFLISIHKLHDKLDLNIDFAIVFDFKKGASTKEATRYILRYVQFLWRDKMMNWIIQYLWIPSP